MKNYTPDNPVFSDSIKILETTDPGHADNVNVTTKQLQDNIMYLKENGTGGKATREEVKNMADELMEQEPGPEPGVIATDEEVEEAIENLDDL